MAIREPRPRGKMQKGRRIGAASPTSQRRLEVLRREERVMQLRLAGLDLATIAREVGYADKAGAHHALRRAMERAMGRVADRAEEYRQVILLRLERMHRSYWMAALGQPAHGTPGTPGYRPGIPPDYKAADRIFKVIEREMALLGLEAPKSVAPPTTPEEIARQIHDALGGIEDSYEPPK